MAYQNDYTTSLQLHYPPSPSDATSSPLDRSHSPSLPLYTISPPYNTCSAELLDIPPLPSTLPIYPGTPSLTSPPPYNALPLPDLSHRSRLSSRATIAHPYARLAAKKDSGKRRKIWNHALEKSLFTPHELSTMGAPHRRTIYISSLEAHIDRLHAQLLSMGLYPIPFEKLEPFRGLNSKTAKSMIAGLQHDDSYAKLKLLELQRSNTGLRQTLSKSPHTGMSQLGEIRRHSVDSSVPHRREVGFPEQ